MFACSLLPAPSHLIPAHTRRGLAIRAVALVTRGFNRAGRIARPDACSRWDPYLDSSRHDRRLANGVSATLGTESGRVATDVRIAIVLAKNRFLAAGLTFPAAPRRNGFAAVNDGNDREEGSDLPGLERVARP